MEETCTLKTIFPKMSKFILKPLTKIRIFTTSTIEKITEIKSYNKIKLKTNQILILLLKIELLKSLMK